MKHLCIGGPLDGKQENIDDVLDKGYSTFHVGAWNSRCRNIKILTLNNNDLTVLIHESYFIGKPVNE